MTVIKSTRCIYANEPIERAPQLSDFAMDTVDIDPDTVTEPGSLLLENLYISLDPYLRGRMKHGVQSYAAPFPLGEPFVSHAISRVLKSNAEGFKAGDLVYLLGRWESHTVYPDASKVPELRVFNPAPGIPLYVYISALGMPGMTAWAGLNILAHPKAGETLFVSAASGAVGQMVVQYGVKNGMRVVGTAGSDEKCEFVKSLGAAECFNYKKPPGGSIEAAVKAACPNGIDVNFENVGEEIYEAVLKNMNPNGRVSVCGWVGADSYNTNRKLFEADKFTTDAAAHNLEYVKFFLVGAYYSQMEEQQKKTAEWLLDGSVVARDDVRDGLENAAGYFIGMLKGENFGKATIRIKQE